MALTKAAHRMIEGGSVKAKDFGAVGDGITDDTAAIQAALDSHTRRITVELGGEGYTYKITDSLVITGDYKVLDGKGSSINTFFTDKIAIAIHPLTTEVQTFSGVKNLSLWGDNNSGNATVGIQISGKSYNAQTSNITINYFGLSPATGGIGFEVKGLAGGGNAPYFGNHINIKTNQCYDGFYVHGTDAASVVTTNTFINPYCATMRNVAFSLKYTTGNVLVGIAAESCVGAGLKLDYVNGLYVQGGFLEGNSPNFVATNSATSVLNTLNLNIAAPTATTATYADKPDSYVAYQTLALKATGSPVVPMVNLDVIALKNAPNKVVIMDRYGSYAELLLKFDGVTHTVEILKTGATNSTWWTTTKGTGSSYNIYWDTTNARFELQTTRSGIMTIQQFTESS
jgi:hypothetical protein